MTGVLVPPRDTSALRSAIDALLLDADRRVRLGSAARERASERFSWDAATAALRNAYDDAVTG